MTTGTNLQLTYDENTDSWSYQNVDYEYPAGSTNSWSGYTTPDPEFEYAPPPPDENEQDNSTVCPPGYIYDETLKQCLPDPNYQAPSWASEPDYGGGGPKRDYAKEAQESAFWPDASTPEGRKAMYEHGLDKGYFGGYDTSKGGAYEFQGPKETGMKLFGMEGYGQFGEDRAYQRYINELAKEDAKRKAAGQTPILAQAVGFFGLTEGFKDWGNYAMDVASNLPTDFSFLTDTTTGFQETKKPDISGPIDYPWAGSPGTVLTEERNQEIHEQKLNQEKIKTKQAQVNLEKTERESESESDKRVGERDAQKQREYSVPTPGTGATGPPGRNYPVTPTGHQGHHR
jgi:hypothetical protein